MNLLNKAKAICAMVMILTVAVAVSCTKTAGIVTPAGGGATTATPTKTPTVALPGTSQIWDDFDEAPWTGFTNAGPNGYLLSVYTESATYNQTTLNTTTYQAGIASMDVNVNFTTATNNLLETTIEDGTAYGAQVNEQNGGVNPTYVSFWVNPTAAMQVTKIWIDNNGTNTGIANAVNCPAGVWTNVVTAIPNTVVAMTKVQAVIIDMTCPTTGVVDVRYDTIAFYSSGNTATPTATPTKTATPTITSTAPTSTPVPGGGNIWDDFDEAPWTGDCNTCPNGYLISTYVQAATLNNWTINNTIHQAGIASLDVNVNFTAATGNLLETTIENGEAYGGSVNEQYSGVNPSYVSFWINPTAAMQVTKVWIDAPSGTNTGIANVVNCPAGVWTNVVTGIPNTAPAMTSVVAVIIDMTCATTGTIDVRYDTIAFLPPGTAVTPSATATPFITNTPTATTTIFPTNTITPTPNALTPSPTPTTNTVWDDFDEAPWTGDCNTCGNGYLVSTYVQAATLNNWTVNTTTYQAGTASLDVNVTFTAATGNLLETTIENGEEYGAAVNENAMFGGSVPTGVSFWVYPTMANMSVAKIYIDAPSGTNTPYVNTTPLPRGVWTNVYQPLTGQSTMASTEAVIIDLTSATATTTDVLYDSICFY
jgi:hypothetical protein